MRFGILVLALFFVIGAQGQEVKLATEYYKNGEYEKAAVIFKKLSNRKGNTDYYFSRYVDCLIQTDEFDQAEIEIKGRIKSKPNLLQNYVTLGNLYEQSGRVKDAEKEYDRAISKLTPERGRITKLANAFVSQKNYDMALKAYDKGSKLLDVEDAFAYQMGDLYRRQGDRSRMIEYYLISLQSRKDQLQNIKNLFSRYLEKEDFLDLQQQLYMQIQEVPESNIYPELLEWVFIQQGDYKNALRQVKALDKRNNEQGLRVYNLGKVALNSKDYEAAIESYAYISSELGIASPYYLDAKREALSAKRLWYSKDIKPDQTKMLTLRTEYEAFLNEFGRNAESADLMLEWSELEARYLDNTTGAIKILKEVVGFSNTNEFTEANAKLALADYYLIEGEIWESTLLYSQVDKDFREGYLGEQARYKNARLSYFNGDFQWAQAQFDILKAATSKLISNDAIDQSVFIMDNLGLDTTALPLQMYAKAELLNFQNKYERSFEKLDSIRQMFPDHQLEDDIWYVKADVYFKKRQYDEAISMYERIVESYPEEIRADNALFKMAEIYEYIKEDTEKAKTLYEKIFIDYSGSTFAVEARKRFRLLRGDEL